MLQAIPYLRTQCFLNLHAGKQFAQPFGSSVLNHVLLGALLVHAPPTDCYKRPNSGGVVENLIDSGMDLVVNLDVARLLIRWWLRCLKYRFARYCVISGKPV